jgi:hypothetical protein
MKIIFIFLSVLCTVPVSGAVTWPLVAHYTWNFTFGPGRLSTTTTDSLAIQLDNTDRLLPSERMIIRLYGGDASEPMFFRDWVGALDGLNGLLTYAENWDVPLADLSGRLELEMESGTVKLHRVTLSIANGTKAYNATITPDVQLVPEPGITLLFSSAGGLAFRRRRGAS